MREFDPYPNYPSSTRVANRTITNRIAASYRDREFYDGDRMNGFGGMKNDGRWAAVADSLIKAYSLTNESNVLQIGCHKGFLLDEFLKRGISVWGVESSAYAISQAPYPVQTFLRKAPFTRIPFGTREMDLVISLNTVYNHTLADAIKCLKEIKRVGKGKSFITLGTYETEAEYFLLRKWFLFSGVVLTRPEWLEVLNHVGYEGDYRFEDAKYLGLVNG